MSWRPQLLGYVGEGYISELLSSLPRDKYIVLDNILLETDRGTTQIDHVIVSIYGVFVIETKNYHGTIIGSRTGENWIHKLHGRNYTIYNPFMQNHGHIMSLQRILNIPLNKFIGIVVFVQACNVEGDATQCVIHSSQLIGVINQFNRVILSVQEMNILATIIAKNSHNGFWDRVNHVVNTQEKIRMKEKQVRQGICPKCYGTLVQKNGKFGLFLGCSNYPNCKYTHKLV